MFLATRPFRRVKPPVSGFASVSTVLGGGVTVQAEGGESTRRLRSLPLIASSSSRESERSLDVMGGESVPFQLACRVKAAPVDIFGHAVLLPTIW